MLIAVIGLGTFGATAAKKIYEKGAEVIAIDKEEKLIDAIKDNVSQVYGLDATNEKALRSINISDVDIALVAIGKNIQMSILVVAMLRKLGVGRVIARANGHIHEHVLKEIGASEVVKVEEEMGDIIASKIVAPHVLQRYNFASGHSLVELKLGKKFDGKTIVEGQVKQKYGLNIIATQKRVPYITEEGKAAFRVEINDNPLPMDILNSDDVVVLVGSDENFNRLFLDLSEN